MLWKTISSERKNNFKGRLYSFVNTLSNRLFDVFINSIPHFNRNMVVRICHSYRHFSLTTFCTLPIRFSSLVEKKLPYRATVTSLFYLPKY